ncbi:hypothetical protein OROMI_023991 [Orobanche minor]
MTNHTGLGILPSTGDAFGQNIALPIRTLSRFGAIVR